MGKTITTKGIIMQGVGKALAKNVNQAPAEYKQFYQAKRFSRETHADALIYLLDLYIIELKKEKCSIIKVQKLLFCLYLSLTEYCKEPKIAIELYTDLKKIKPAFITFKESNEKNSNDMINEIVDSIDNLLISMRPELRSEDISIAQMMKDKLDEANDTINEKNKEIERLKQEFERYSKNIKRDINYEEKYKNKKKELENVKIDNEKEKKDLLKTITEKDSTIEECKNKITELENNIETIEREKNNVIKRNEKEENIISIITEELLKQDISHNKLLEIINNKGYCINNNELFNLLKKTMIRIDTFKYCNGQPIYSLKKSYKVDKCLNIRTNNTFNILIISDLNIISNSIDIYTKLEKIYTYCNNNDIEYLFILGNIININTTPTIETLKNIEKILKEIINNYPQDNNITNFIMGGNNELELTNIGYNFLDNLSESRYDFYTLGYKDSSLSINGINNIVNFHHSNNDINDYISNYYYNKDISIISSLDIINTNNCTMIDPLNRTITIPPLLSCNKGCSIYQVELILNEGTVKRYNIYPMMQEELIPTSKIIIYK